MLVRVSPQISHLVRSFHSSRRVYAAASAVKLPPEKDLLAAFEFFQLNPQAEVPLSEAKAAWMSVSLPSVELMPCLDARLMHSLLKGTHEPRDAKRDAR